MTLEERIEKGFPESWRPEEGEKIIGTVVEYGVGPTDYGERDTVVVRLADGTEKTVWLLHDVLINQFKREKPQPGERIAVKYVGQKTNPTSQRRYKDYRLMVERSARGCPFGTPGESTEKGTPYMETVGLSPDEAEDGDDFHDPFADE